MLFCRHYFSPLTTFKRKGKDPDPHLLLMEPDPDPGGPKTCGSCGSGSWSPTLTVRYLFIFLKQEAETTLPGVVMLSATGGRHWWLYNLWVETARAASRAWRWWVGRLLAPILRLPALRSGIPMWSVMHPRESCIIQPSFFSHIWLGNGYLQLVGYEIKIQLF